MKLPALPIMVAVCAHCLMSAPPTVRAVTAEDFGFGALKANGQPVIGSIPLLVIIYEMANGTSPDGSTREPLVPDLVAKMDRMIFNFFAFPSLNGYTLENSYGAFSWQRAGVLGPVTLDATETTNLYAQTSDDDGDGTNETGLDAAAGFRYLLGIVAAKTNYDFAQWDNNGDSIITQDELSVVVIGNNSHLESNGTSSSRAGANRPIAGGLNWAVPGQNVTLRGQIASLDNRTSFMTLTHELAHSLGTTDLYGNGCFSSGLSLMTCTIYGSDDDHRTFHLDPWHKMRLAWLRPRIFTLGTGGITTIAASQRISAETPVILYDPAKGLSEYFIVEFRNNRLPGGDDHDQNLTDPSQATPFTGAAAGMAVWHVDLANGNSLTYHEAAPNFQMGGSTLWNGMTPALRWSDGTETATRLNAAAMINDGRDLVFEWITASDTWAEVQYNGPEFGTFVQPFNTLGEAVNAASHGGTVKFKQGGSTAETLSIVKRVDLLAMNGPVTIGQ